MATLLIGYDVEGWDAEITPRFLDAMEPVHTRHGAPCTLFVLGATLERCASRVRALEGGPLWDLQQHTYTHVRFKAVVEEAPEGTTLYAGGTVKEIRDSVRRANKVMARVLGRPALGVTGPFCYYRGLMDRPDVLRVLHTEGLRFLRTYGRDARGWQPVPLDVQPFWYAPQGYPDMLEIPIQQWQDCLWRRLHGWDDIAGYRVELRRCVDEAVARDAVWGYCAHDWSTIRGDPALGLIDDLLSYARDRGMRVLSHRAFYEAQRRIAGDVAGTTRSPGAPSAATRSRPLVRRIRGVGRAVRKRIGLVSPRGLHG
jgi:peptidoglycan/xylan/chitin deacetylase (PgdA/CDA1 family)